MNVPAQLPKYFLVSLLDFRASFCSTSISFKALPVEKDLSNLNVRATNSKHWFKYAEQLTDSCLKYHQGKNCFEQEKQLLSCISAFKVTLSKRIGLDGNHTRIQRVTGYFVMTMTLQYFSCSKGTSPPQPREFARAHKIPNFTIRNQIWNKLIFSFQSFCYQFLHRLSFNLHRSLSGNVTVHELFLSSGPLDCVEANLTVVKDNLIYCGHYTNLEIFPQFQRFNFLLFVSYRSYFHFHSEFSVVDSNFMFSSQWYLSPLIHPVLFTQRRIRSQIILWIIVNKWLYLAISCFGLAKCEVYDGPGNLSPLVVGKNNIYILSAFASFVKANYNRKKILSGTLNYSSMKNAKSIGVEVAQNLSQLLFSPKGQLEIISFYDPKGQQLNITLLDMTYVGKAIIYKGYHLDASTCNFAGIVAVEQVGKHHQESFTSCTNHSHRTGFSRSFYSFDTKLQVIGYSFSNYGRVNVHLLLSTTKCRSVPVFVCEHTKMPIPKYANEILQYEKVKNRVNIEFAELFRLTHISCVIFQFHLQMFEASTYLQHGFLVFNPCVKSLKLHYVQEKDILTHFNLKAVLKYPLIFSTENKLALQTPREEDLEHLKFQSLFQNKRQSVCIADEEQMSCNRRQIDIVPEYKYWRRKGTKNKINIVINAVYYPDFLIFIYDSPHFLHINLFPHTDSWVDLIMSASIYLPKTEEDPLSLDQGQYRKGDFDIVLPAGPHTSYHTSLEFMDFAFSGIFAFKLSNVHMKGKMLIQFGYSHQRERHGVWFFTNSSQDYLFFSSESYSRFADIHVIKYENKSFSTTTNYLIINDNFEKKLSSRMNYTCMTFVKHYPCKDLATSRGNVKKRRKLSWSEANKACLSQNKTLPFFTNAREFNYFLWMIKEAKHEFKYAIVGLQRDKQKVFCFSHFL